MKYSFDQFEIEPIGNQEANVYWLGKHRGLKYRIFLRPKNFLERLTVSCPESKHLPNIILKRKFRGMKIVFTKSEGATIQFTLCSYFFAFGFGSSSSFYVSEFTANGLIQKLIDEANTQQEDVL